MRKSDFAGWSDVFRFTLIQGVKQKAYYGFMIFMCVILLCSVPVIGLIRQIGSDEAETTKVTALTIFDETGLSVDYTYALDAESRCANVQIVTDTSLLFDAESERLQESEDSTELLVRIRDEDGYFSLTFVKAANADLTDKDVEIVETAFEAFFSQARIRAVEVTEEQLDFLNRPVEAKVEFAAEDGNLAPEKEENEGISMEQYFLLLGEIMVVMLIISLSGSSIANSIVTEKSTRVVEYLMIHVRAMALITGKILAALALVMMQCAAFGISYGLSVVISMVLSGGESGAAWLTEVGNSTAGGDGIALIPGSLTGLNIGNLVIAVLLVLAGILFYSILAGLAGASASKIEELGEAMKLYQLVLVLGTYLGLGMCIVEMMGGANRTFVYICSLFPLSAPFTAPANLLIGEIPPWIGLISLLLLCICVALLFCFTAKVYESMLFYNGKVLKLRDILRIAQERKKKDGKEQRGHA